MSADPFEAFIAQLDLSGIPGSDDPLDEEELEQRDRLARLTKLLDGHELQAMPNGSPEDIARWQDAASMAIRQYQVRLEPSRGADAGPVYRLDRSKFFMMMFTAIALANSKIDPVAMDLAGELACVRVGFNGGDVDFTVDVLKANMNQANYAYAQIWPRPPDIETSTQ